MAGEHTWLAKGVMDLGLSAEDFKTRALTDAGREVAGEARRSA